MGGLVGHLLGRLRPKATESLWPPARYASPKSWLPAGRPPPLAAVREPAPGMTWGPGGGGQLREGVRRAGRLSVPNGARERPGRGDGKAGGKQ